MQRDTMQELITWKNRPNRKPLIVQGARQTGKTWLIKHFAQAEFDDYVLLDFMYDTQARSIFDGSLDPRRIIKLIELRSGKTITPGKTLIVFDEIQEAPHELTSLKYFCEQAPEYHVIAAGSYMGIALRNEGESFPVGKVDKITLRPMGFVEFIRAIDGDPLADALQATDMQLLSEVEDKLVQKLKEYYIVGGMPEVVDTYRRTNDLAEARRLQTGILESYDADFAKHAPSRILERMRLTWASLPGQLAKENKKFVYGDVRPGARARDFEESLQWLADYGATHKVPRASALRVPLASYEDMSAFKLFCCDIGLLGAQAGLNPAVIMNGSELFTEFKGALTEQYVEQELRLAGYTPVYWSSESGNAKTDFAIPSDNKVIPIEVKAAENLRSKSLKAATDKFKLGRCVRTSLSSFRDEGWLVNIPLWAIGQIDELV